MARDIMFCGPQGHLVQLARSFCAARKVLLYGPRAACDVTFCVSFSLGAIDIHLNLRSSMLKMNEVHPSTFARSHIDYKILLLDVPAARVHLEHTQCGRNNNTPVIYPK